MPIIQTNANRHERRRIAKLFKQPMQKGVQDDHVPLLRLVIKPDGKKGFEIIKGREEEVMKKMKQHE